MIYLPLEHLKPGMVVAKNIYMDFSFLPLITKGQVLNTFIIRQLKLKEISGLYVESDVGNDIVVKSIIDNDLKRSTISGVKEIFSSLEKNTQFTQDDFKSVSKMANDLVLNILSNDELLINMIELKSHSNYTYYHCLCVSIISVVIGIKHELEYADLVNLATCGLLHDIGKAMIPIEILDKPSYLTDEEFEIIKTHPGCAKLLLEANKNISYEMLNSIKGHHEKFDGSGYPDGLSGYDIPLFSRIIAIADVYDALTSQRAYRKAWFPSDAIEYMMGCAESHFDTDLLKTFLTTVAVYPEGTIVLLSNGEKAVVIKNYSENTLRPSVRTINEKGEHMEELNLMHDKKCMNIVITGMGYDKESGNFVTLQKKE
ncbi:HD-GYP domain-containing protein [Anaerovorax odorimutans]|uniref:HD-GYP domain-containing protein n=1 Tax=Anaerovorax odorimutans TaxID=109327 RepID=UPI000407A5BF|nr:HD-GYP domain-containing protein [Anaerovorax odorimutans]